MQIEPPAWWELELIGGQTVELWADGYSEADGWYEFTILADTEDSEQQQLEIAGRTPSNPRRVLATVARVPTEIVASIRGGGPGKAAWVDTR